MTAEEAHLFGRVNLRSAVHMETQAGRPAAPAICQTSLATSAQSMRVKRPASSRAEEEVGICEVSDESSFSDRTHPHEFPVCLLTETGSSSDQFGPLADKNRSQNALHAKQRLTDRLHEPAARLDAAVTSGL